MTQSYRKLPDHCSVFDAEVNADPRDLDLILQTNELMFNEIDYYIDNQATLRSLNQIKIIGFSKVRMIRSLKDFTSKYGLKVNFYWVKGHSGIFGNEIAKKGARIGPVIKIPPSLTHIKSTLKSRKLTALDKPMELSEYL